MQYETNQLDQWLYANSDLIFEDREKNSKSIILISGASSSGKTHVSSCLQLHLQKFNLKSTIISLDSYNVGLSHIIPNKVNLNYFNNKLKNIEEIESRIKDIIYDVDFSMKYCDDVIEKIKDSISDLISKKDLESFLQGLKVEWGKLNFDEPTVYDLKEAANDAYILFNNSSIKMKKYSKVVSERIDNDITIDGKDYDVIIVEGIYALDKILLDELKKLGIKPIKNFIEGNPKSLFLRRIIRDSKETSADNIFTISSYFKYIVPAYNDTILPNKKFADVVLHNEMTFEEMREGNLYKSKYEYDTDDKAKVDKLLSILTIYDKRYQKDYFLSYFNEDNTSLNRLRLRTISNSNKIDSFKLGSLVHKGIPKIRSDNKIIRPINVLLDEDNISKVWNSLFDALSDFLNAGFNLSYIKEQLKIRAHYFDQQVTIKIIKNQKIKIEISTPMNEEFKEEFKKIFKNSF